MTEAELALLDVIPDAGAPGTPSVVFPDGFYLTIYGSMPYLPDPSICGSGGGGGGGGPCEDDRPDTGMLYPRG